MDKTRILLVTPEGLDRKMISFRLENEGYKVIHCANKSEIEFALNSKKPNLIIFKSLDGLGVNDFMDFLKFSEIEKIPFILIESVKESYLRVNTFHKRITAYILSPVSPKELIGKIEELLHKKLSFQPLG